MNISIVKTGLIAILVSVVCIAIIKLSGIALDSSITMAIVVGAVVGTLSVMFFGKSIKGK